MYADELAHSYAAVRERLGMGFTPQASPIPRKLVNVAPKPPKPIPEINHKPIWQTGWRKIMREVCEKHDITIRDLTGKSRVRHIVAAKKEAAYRMVTERGMTYMHVAARMGYKEHSAILYLYNGYKEYLLDSAKEELNG